MRIFNGAYTNPLPSEDILVIVNKKIPNPMENIATILISLGFLLFIGLATDAIGRYTRLPRVTLLLFFGFLIGPSLLNLLPTQIDQLTPIIANIALAMIGFLLGGKLTKGLFLTHGRDVIWISVVTAIFTALIVLFGLLLLQFRFDIAIILSAIAAATAPAATVSVVKNLNAKGDFTKTLLGIVAVDDAWALIIFTFALIIVHSLQTANPNMSLALDAAWGIGGSIILGVVLGIPMAYITGHIEKGEPTQIEALSLVFLCSGIAMWMHVSFLLACMVMGSIVSNYAHHHRRPFHEIENIDWPFMIIFFILAGSALHISAIASIGFIGLAYILLRVVGRLFGAYLGGKISHASPQIQGYMGMALMPQAGVAIGMALVTSETFPKLGEFILPIVLGATIIFEISGPIMTKFALTKVNEVHI